MKMGSKRSKPAFGMAEYFPPKTKHLQDYPKLSKFSPSKRVTLFNPETPVPPPGHYTTETEWVKKNKRFTFSKLPKILMTVSLG